ncbi:PAQR family membrane homeostasis protein TrhA [Algoriphagus mannitolivorans]|uniref:PAQR family membrane homeostasis protein TrhA n=1 Tax=Algoriphagus mannitolivorans TaxID=226504 RepID=UPI0003F568E6|nr:hemolysin III family protein [Algoriphagus mannitolivorans]
MQKSVKRAQTDKEENLNAWTHGFGLLLGIIGIPFLISKAWQPEDFKYLLGASTFSLGILMVYGFSTAYHAAKNPKKKAKLQIMDHVSIYFLIAGSYTPMVLAILKTDKAILFLSIIWASVLIGTFFKLFFTGKFKTLSVVIYLTMGWLAVFFLKDLVDRLSLEILVWIGLGGLSYTLGVIFYVQSNRPYFHTLWHLFVLGGTAAHFVAVYQLQII